MDPIHELSSCGVGVASSTLVGLLSGVGVVEVDGGIFHRITMTSMTGAWYLTISNFEAIIVGLVILEIFVLRYLLILPLDFSKWIQQGILLQTAVSRRRRRRHTHSNSEYSQSPGLAELAGKELEDALRLLDTMITAVRRLDKDDCLLRALCELEGGRRRQEKSGCGPTSSLLPTPVMRTLLFLKGWGDGPLKWPSFKSPVMSQLQSAVHRGGVDSCPNATTSAGESGCGPYYPSCPLTPGEIQVGLELYFSVISNSDE